MIVNQNYPSNEYFGRYADIYSNFVGIIDRLSTKDLIEENFEQIKSNSVNLWITFAPGLSFKNHESYYEKSK